MECPKCGNEVKESDKKCPYCNKVLQLECPVCHKFNRGTVCEECGNVIIVKCHQCGTPGPNTGKCRKCGFPTMKSVIMNEAETEEYACLAITFPNLENLRPALKNKQIFNKFKKKLKQALFGYAKSQDNRAQAFGETYVIKYYKEFSFTSSVKKAVKSAIELLNKIGGISYKLKKSKKVRLHCKMTILKKTFETDTNEFNTGLNIKLIKDNTEEKYTDGLQLITDQYINNIISREYTLEMIYSSQVGDELLMFYEFPLEDQIIPIVEEEKVSDNSILKGPKELPKLKIYDDDDQLNEILYGNKAIDISTEGQFLSVPAHEIFNTLNDLLNAKAFIALKTTERRDLPTSDVLNYLKTKSQNVWHAVCKENSKYKPYDMFVDLFTSLLKVDLNQENFSQAISSGISAFDTNGLFTNLLNNNPPSEDNADATFTSYANALRDFLTKQKNVIIFIENFDLIDETSLKIINNFISSLVNAEELGLTFVVTVRSEYSVYKSIPRLLHSPFYKEINVTKGEYSAFLDIVPDDISDIKDSFYISKLEERCSGSLIYFKNVIKYLRDTNVFITFEGKLMINAEKTIVYPGTVQELFTKRFTSLPENEGLVVAYTILLNGKANIKMLAKLIEAEKFEEVIQSVVNKALVSIDEDIISIENYRIFRPALLKALTPEIKKILIENLNTKLGYSSYELLEILGQNEEKLEKIYEAAKTAVKFGDFNAFLNCAKLYFNLLEKLEVEDEDEEVYIRKNELYSILVNHLNRYPSTKVYSISRAILASATANKDDETIVNVSNLVLDSAIRGGDYVLAQQCIQNILTRILNPNLLVEGMDYTPQSVLYSCINAKVLFHLSRYSECIAICERIMDTFTPEFMDKLSASGLDKAQFNSYVMDIMTYGGLSMIITCDGVLQEFLDKAKNVFGSDILAGNYLLLLEKLYHNDEVDNNAGISSDVISIFISNIITAFKSYGEGFNTFAQNIYKAKMSVNNENLLAFSLICDLLIGYSYQKINLENPVSWKKTETIYEDVLRMAQKSGLTDIVLWTNWFKGTLMKDKEALEDAYDHLITLANTIKRQRTKDRLLLIATYILTLNIVAKIEAKKNDVPILVYRIMYESERYNMEGFYKFIEDQRVLDPEYMEQFKEAIAAEQAALEAERAAEEEELKAAAAAQAEAENAS